MKYLAKSLAKQKERNSQRKNVFGKYSTFKQDQ